MTAFDAAWSVVKAPLLPRSLKDKGGMKWEGVFEDPKTKEHLPLRFQGSNSMDSEMLSRDLDMYDLDEEEEENWQHFEDFERDYPPDPDDVWSRLIPETEWSGEIGDDEPRGHLRTDYKSPQQVHQVGVESDYRRRGYATALYDALAHILMQTQNRRLVPSSDRLDEGKRLWGGKDPNRKVWPVRDDL